MILRFAILLFTLVVWQCTTQNVPTYNELTIQLVNQLRPHLFGSWQFKETWIDAEKLKWSSNYTGITKDTVLQNLATLTVEPFTGIVSDERLLNLNGSIQFRGKDYPVEIKVYPSQNMSTTKGVMWITFRYTQSSIDYNSADVKFMESLGLVNVNFDFNTEIGRPTMTLRSTDKSIVLANLVKNR